MEQFKANIVQNIYKVQTPHELQAIKTIYPPIEPTLYAIRNSPTILKKETLLTAHNKKITPQRRLYATRREKKKSNKMLTKPTSQEANRIIAVQLMALNLDS